MRTTLLVTLFIIGCTSATTHTLPPTVAKPASVSAPITPPPSEEETEESEAGPSLRATGLWLMLLGSNIGLTVQDATKACEALDGKVTFMEESPEGKWHNCSDNYQFVTRDEHVVYLADGSFPFTKDQLIELLGPVQKVVPQQSEGTSMVGNFWKVKLGQPVVIEFWEIAAKGDPTFVGIRAQDPNPKGKAKSLSL